MNKLEIRKALATDLEEIYMMGYDEWAEGSSTENYLNECKTSLKYKKGIWYVLADQKQLFSSLILYNFEANIYGIGSIATPPLLRRQGWASKIISGVINEIESQRPDALIFLYSDINPEFYEKFRFMKLPTDLQRYKTTTCMVRSPQSEQSFLSKNFFIPEYF